MPQKNVRLHAELPSFKWTFLGHLVEPLKTIQIVFIASLGGKSSSPSPVRQSAPIPSQLSLPAQPLPMSSPSASQPLSKSLTAPTTTPGSRSGSPSGQSPSASGNYSSSFLSSQSSSSSVNSSPVKNPVAVIVSPKSCPEPEIQAIQMSKIQSTVEDISIEEGQQELG